MPRSVADLNKAAAERTLAKMPQATIRASSAGSSTGSRTSSVPAAMASRIRIAIAGAGGRMGQALVERALDAADLAIAAALDVRGASAIGADAGRALGRTTGVAIGDDVDAALANADVLIDFTRPEGTLMHAAACAKRGVALVAGTTGLSDAQKDELARHAKAIPIVHAANMSVGVNVLADLVARAAKALGDAYDIEVVEMHHRHKVDAPSGTALMLGAAAAGGAGLDLKQAGVYAREGVTGERRKGTIGLRDAARRRRRRRARRRVRGRGRARRARAPRDLAQMFADGALRAVRFVAAHRRERRAGLYDMRDVLGL
jgi:4-hydroxy-tetrahydrodipicolinate reductase